MPSAGTNTFVPVPTSCGGPNVPPAGRKLAAAAPTSLRCPAATRAPVGPIATTGDDTPDASGCAIPHGPPGVRTHAEMLESGVWPLLQTATAVPAPFTSKASSIGPFVTSGLTVSLPASKLLPGTEPPPGGRDRNRISDWYGAAFVTVRT